MNTEEILQDLRAKSAANRARLAAAFQAKPDLAKKVDELGICLAVVCNNADPVAALEAAIKYREQLPPPPAGCARKGDGGLLKTADAEREHAKALSDNALFMAGTSSSAAPAASDQAERIRALKIDVDAVRVAAERQGLDPVAALAATIEDRERDLKTEPYVSPVRSGR